MNKFECYKCRLEASQVVTLCQKCASDIKESLPTDTQQLKAEIAALADGLEAHDLQLISAMKIDVVGRLRQLSAI